MTDESLHETRDLEMPVRYRITFAGPLGPVIMYLQLAALTGVAISHFMHSQTTPWTGLIAAGIWLFGVAVCLWGLCEEDGSCGPFQFLMNRLRTFAGRQFVHIQRRSGAVPVVGVGYWIGSWRFYYFRIPLNGIIEVEWSTGQATSIVGRDMDDWTVFFWYERGAVIGRFGRALFRKGKDVHCLGGSGPKENAAEFGRRLVAFLLAGGADLVEVEEGRKYVRRVAQSAHS